MTLQCAGARLLAPQKGGLLNRADDFVVAGAAAEIARQIEANLLLAGIGILPQQRRRRHDESRRADAALQGGRLQECVLDRIQTINRGNAFDRFKVCPLDLNRQHQTAIDGPSVHQHGAGSAVPVSAAPLSCRSG